VKYAFITRHKNTYPISLQCQVLGVSRACYYHYRRHTEDKPADPEHQDMLEWVKRIAVASDDTYGSRRMQRALNGLGYPISRHKASKLMREAGVQVRHRKKYKVTTNSNHTNSRCLRTCYSASLRCCNRIRCTPLTSLISGHRKAGYISP